MFKELGIKSWMLTLPLLPCGLLILALGAHAIGMIALTSLQQSYLGSSLALLALGLGVWLARRLGHALQRRAGQLRQDIAKLHAEQPDAPVQQLPGNALDQLAADIHQLAQTLPARHNAMQRQLQHSQEDCRQLRQTAEVQRIELDMARQEALAASRIKHDFLANMGHEIRTPLNGILGFTHLLYKSALSAQQLDHLQTIQHSAENLLGMFNQALDAAGSENSSLRLQSQPFNLRDLVEDCLSVVAPAAHEKQLELVSMVYHDTPQRLIGDATQLRQILINLISNATALADGGSIVLRVMLEDDSSDFAELRISIQLSPAKTHTEPLPLLAGNSMGLAIAKRLAVVMGGKLDMHHIDGNDPEWWLSISLEKTEALVEPSSIILTGQHVAIFEPHPLAQQSLLHQLQETGLQVLCHAQLDGLLQAVSARRQTPQAVRLAVLGTGTTTLGLEQLHAYLQQLQQLDCQCLLLCPTSELQQLSSLLVSGHCQLQAKPAASRKLVRALEELLGSREKHPGVSSPITRAQAENNAKVLCVDDNPANLLLVQTLLSDMGACVTAVDSGYAAVEACAAQDFDLILMDIQMPGMDGRQASLAIRQREQLLQQRAVPIIALTAHVPQGQKRSLQQAGINDLLSKPVSEVQLAELLQRWTGTTWHIPTGTQALPASRQLAILDPDEGLRLAGGKAELAKDLLDMLLDSLAEEQQAIRQAYARDDANQLADRVHRLLGAARYCGVPELRTACQHCENRLRHDPRQAAPALEQLDRAISRLRQASQSAQRKKTP